MTSRKSKQGHEVVKFFIDNSGIKITQNIKITFEYSVVKITFCLYNII
jgi:hypothetical protein